LISGFLLLISPVTVKGQDIGLVVSNRSLVDCDQLTSPSHTYTMTITPNP